ncbi:MAG: L28 family ribosomal protein [Candidatus Faecisoma sp.]|nr:hypothetical protein [Acholeplasma sp.]MCI5678229.1 hypothetical protein [Acholeplasma sp.]MDY2892479.1 L28 family ribosomal protein [Candidatus Faecisoma sp.]
MAKNVSSVKPQSGNLRSHSNRAVKHSRKPNLQNITIDGKTVRMSAREIRSLKKTA